MNEVTNDEISIAVGEETFVFRLPSPRAYAKMGSRSAVMRREDAPESGGSDWGLDSLSQDLYQAMALFDTLLIRADTRGNWHISTNEKGGAVIDSTKFPPTVTLTMLEAFRGFSAKVSSFLDRQSGSEKPKSSEDTPSLSTS